MPCIEYVIILNALPQYIINLNSDEFISFKSEVDEYIMNLPDIPRVVSHSLMRNSLYSILEYYKVSA